jgi:sec-independent protein translocase protein TatA
MLLPHLGPLELIIILVIIIIIFGVGRLPEVGGAIGKGIREFRKASTEADEAKKEIEGKADAEEEKPA